MSSESLSSEESSERSSRTVAWVLIAVTIAAVFVRFYGLGARSLWLDEFCTWHVSRMEFWEGLRWGPELTIPPLYQFVLRCVTASSHPPEWLLRLPAAVCGVLLVPAAWWLGRVLANRQVGLALAALVAFNSLQIEYSREARPYSMLVLGCTLSVTSWCLLVTRSRRSDFWMYVVVTTVIFYAHFLIALTVAAELIWWWLARRRDTRIGRFVTRCLKSVASNRAATVRERYFAGDSPLPYGRVSEKRLFQHALRPLFALGLVAILCVPLAWRSVYYRSSITQAVDWIDPPTWERMAGTLGELTFGPLWIVVMLALSCVLFFRGKSSRKVSLRRVDEDSPGGSGFALDILLCIWWLLSSWLGLLLLSWFVLPMTVTRYALPAAIPALLLPLVFAARVHRWGPLVLAATIILGTAPSWMAECTTAEPGFRELTQYIRETADPETDAVVIVVGHSSTPHWTDMQRLALRYYSLDDRPVREIVLDERNQAPASSNVLDDPRRLFLIAFRSDPISMTLEAGRRIESFVVAGQSYQQLLFAPYRLVKVAPLALRRE